MKRFALIAGTICVCVSTVATPTRGAGPDVLYSGINDSRNHGNIGGIRA